MLIRHHVHLEKLQIHVIKLHPHCNLIGTNGTKSYILRPLVIHKSSYDILLGSLKLYHLYKVSGRAFKYHTNVFKCHEMSCS